MRHRLERSAMNRTRPVFMKFNEVEFGAVALVLAKTIFRELGAKFTHQTIACHLGDDARGSDGQTDAIAIDDRGLPQRKWGHGKSVDELEDWAIFGTVAGLL